MGMGRKGRAYVDVRIDVQLKPSGGGAVSTKGG
jgi:hypothetical protein